ncbi:flagellar biosynthesis protein FlhF [Paenibacillus herberti]|uniref:flagellar biosynthesis protein FlhF n=1 Tax=Paenibacillus herberti TaxID=1619309 RepID=UPI002481FB07|nr:flagellar biosynthesis protein FlhF [Paenibacillus herberti]
MKRYLVGSVPEALPMIRSELGSDAVILSTKEIKTGGFLGLFGKRRIEVIAAVETGGAAAPVRKPVAPSAPIVRPAAPAAFAPNGATPPLAAQAAMSAADAMSAAALEQPPAPRIAASLAASSYAGSPAHVLTSPAPAPTAQPLTGLQEELLQEVRGLKTWMRQMSAQQAQAALSGPAKKLLERLEQQEVTVDCRERLLQELQADPGFDALSEDGEALWKAAKERIMDWLQPYEPNEDAFTPKAIHFVGPTGVGKTTTIAKLAALETLKNKRSVGLITADTYRIAAVDQLRTYGDILGVPLEVVFSPAETVRAFQQLAGRDLILMDTAGRNYRSELQISEVSSLLRAGEGSETCLVLSLTARTSDMEAVALPFIRNGVNKVIFTKLDETRIYGSLLNLVLEHGLQPLYLAFGQTVPDDLEPFNSLKYSSLLLGDYEDV